MSESQATKVSALVEAKSEATNSADRKKASAALDKFHRKHVNHTVRLTEKLEKATGLESRLTILGHLQRGGTPSAADRVLATRLGTACAEVLARKEYGVLVAARGSGTATVPLEQVAGRKNLVPLDHPWVRSARLVGVCLGDDWNPTKQ